MIGLEYLLQKLNKTFLLIFVLISPLIYSEAIVNVEDLRRDGEKGFFANISGSLSFSRGNRNRDSFSLQSSLDYNLENLESFFVVKRSQKQINKSNYDSATLAHIRLNFLFDDDPSLEAFIQYSKNPFRKFNKRELIGLGARFNIENNLKAGIGLMNEDEEDLLAIIDNTLRVTSYIHSEFIIDENIVFDLSAFLQPSTVSFSDYKATLIGQFDFHINENFKISLQYNTFYDSRPPSSAVKKEEGFATVFSYNFN
tara:strand:- start:6621 stop:7385 length:765 start_codon:yes stop_codon:yes gene_type:complete